MCKFAEERNFKMTQNLYLHVFTEMGWEENVSLDDPIARQGLHEEKKKRRKRKSFLYSSVSFWCAILLLSVVKVLLFSFILSLRLIVALAAAFVGTWMLHTAEGPAQVCVNVTLCVLYVLLLALVYGMLLTTVHCWVFFFLLAQKKWTVFHASDAMENKQLTSLDFFFSYLYKFVDYV